MPLSCVCQTRTLWQTDKKLDDDDFNPKELHNRESLVKPQCVLTVWSQIDLSLEFYKL